MCVPYLHVSLWFGRRVPHSHPGLVCFLGRRMESSVPEATAVGFLTVPSQPGAVLTLSCKVEIGLEVVLITFSLGHNFCDEERPAIIPFLWLYELLLSQKDTFLPRCSPGPQVCLFSHVSGGNRGFLGPDLRGLTRLADRLMENEKGKLHSTRWASWEIGRATKQQEQQNVSSFDVLNGPVLLWVLFCLEIQQDRRRQGISPVTGRTWRLCHLIIWLCSCCV